ncbi:hexamerin 109 isoform X1 [Nasonia vitripennis]|uniref:Uncharacterized protein n=1 Tax=Nasonia vitripennis TaxID=7425 RepID=A0A7M7PXX6_NASVI|nr:hexamerin 109 isoform X1 [Nasonia vitripennis]
MRFSIVFLALFALAAAIPTTPKLHAADQDILKKQQHVIHLLENIVGELPHQYLYEIGYKYEFEPYLQNYENPSVVKYYLGLVKTGHVQPKGTPFSVSVSQLRKEVALLTQIFLGAKDYETFLNTAAWARVYVNQDQFVKAFSSAVIQRPDTQGVILPPAYEVYPHYFFDTRIIQKVHDYMNQYGYEHHGEGEQHHEHVHHIHVNYTSYLPFGENQIAYFTEDIGLSAYYSYVHLSSYILHHGQQLHGYGQKYPQGGFKGEGEYHHHHGHVGHGAHFYYIHQQLLARYNLERLGQGLEPIRELDNYWEHIETPYKPHLRYLNGVNFPGRDEHHYITPRHHNYELIKLVRALERRIVDAIDLGHVITPQGAFLSLYQPEGLNILGQIIEGTGHSINPRYYGSYQAVAKQLLGNAPEFNNIYEYSPSALELGQTAVRDPIFYQLYSKIIELFHYYQEALPAYQYNDVVVPGVHIEKVQVGDLVTYFSDYEVELDNAVPHPVEHHHQHEHQPFPHVRAHLKRLDHKQYEYTIHVNAEKPVQGAVVRVYVGPKYNYDGQPIDINVHRHYFFELDQFYYDIVEGHNAIVRNSHQATGQSYDWPSVQQIRERVEGAIKSQNPYYITYPQQLFGFPARLSLPKGTKSGFPLQFFVIITAGIHHQPEHYGPVVEENWMTYQPHHYQIVSSEDYEQFAQHPVDKIHGGYQSVDVIPDFDNHVITEGNWHWGYLYKKYPGSYYYPHWQQTHYSYGGEHHYEHHYPEHHEGQYHGEQHVEQHGEHHGEQYHGKHHHAGEQYHGEQYHGQQYHGVHHGYAGEQYHGKTPYHGVEQGKTYHGEQYHGTAHHGHGFEHEHEYYGSGHYPGASEYHGTYPTGTYKGYQGHEEQLQQFYNNEFIGDIIGGAISLDGKPLGYPFDRQLAHSAFYAHNIYLKDVVVYHHDEYFTEY